MNDFCQVWKPDLRRLLPAHYISGALRASQRLMALGTSLKQTEPAQLVAMTRFFRPRSINEIASLQHCNAKKDVLLHCPPLLLVGVPLSAKNRPPFAAFAGLKTTAQYAILSLGRTYVRFFYAHPPGKGF
jgi:hypothetical protein